MKTSILTLALVPAVIAASGIKLWKTKPGSFISFEDTRCYATVDNDYGCQKACQKNDARHVFFNEANWLDNVSFGKFTDPRGSASYWLNIWPDDEKNTWGVYVEGGDGKKIGLCKKTSDVECKCNEGSASGFAWCEMYD